ncbi:hypothetical protein J2853_009650 [Streptosporangium lutulentum]|uniref:Uncharacterized protein n=1 Tax=Streptosporangium lutulentum TaxID=1461250 RepID=A0ABT9QWE0_9ACTN|nr:hypothetical protein [Streptosporangium lutulentum]
MPARRAEVSLRVRGGCAMSVGDVTHQQNL